MHYTDGDNAGGVTSSTWKCFLVYLLYVAYGFGLRQKYQNTNKTQVFQSRIVHRAIFVAPIYNIYLQQHSPQGPP